MCLYFGSSVFGGLGEKFSYPSPLRRLKLIAFKVIERSHAPPPPRCSRAASQGCLGWKLGTELRNRWSFVFTYLCNPEGRDFAHTPAAPSGQVCNSVASHFVKRDFDHLVGKC